MKQKDTRLRWFFFGLSIYIFALVGFVFAMTKIVDHYQWNVFSKEHHCTETGKRFMDLTGDQPFSLRAWSGNVYLCDDGRWELDQVVVR